MPDETASLADEVRARREALGLSRDQLAARVAGCDPQRLYRIETGRTRRPRGCLLRRLAAALGLPPAALLPASSPGEAARRRAPSAGPAAGPIRAAHAALRAGNAAVLAPPRPSLER